MDSSQSPSHNSINATTQESTGGRKNTLFYSTVWDVRTRPKSVQYKKKKEEQKLLQNKETERPMTFTNSLFSQVHLNNAG